MFNPKLRSLVHLEGKYLALLSGYVWVHNTRSIGNPARFNGSSSTAWMANRYRLSDEHVRCRQTKVYLAQNLWNLWMKTKTARSLGFSSLLTLLVSPEAWQSTGIVPSPLSPYSLSHWKNPLRKSCNTGPGWTFSGIWKLQGSPCDNCDILMMLSWKHQSWWLIHHKITVVYQWTSPLGRPSRFVPRMTLSWPQWMQQSDRTCFWNNRIHMDPQFNL